MASVVAIDNSTVFELVIQISLSGQKTFFKDFSDFYLCLGCFTIKGLNADLFWLFFSDIRVLKCNTSVREKKITKKWKKLEKRCARITYKGLMCRLYKGCLQIDIKRQMIQL